MEARLNGIAPLAADETPTDPPVTERIVTPDPCPPRADKALAGPRWTDALLALSAWD